MYNSKCVDVLNVTLICYVLHEFELRICLLPTRFMHVSLGRQNEQRHIGVVRSGIGISHLTCLNFINKGRGVVQVVSHPTLTRMVWVWSRVILCGVRS